jgi:hypothetical protein
MPQEVHSDQGRNFESRLFQETLRLLGIKKTRTTAYNPKSDGMIERFNKTLMNIVSLMLEPIQHQRDWDEQLKFACLAYRSSRHESTGESPNMLMLGREVSTPIDVMFESPDDSADAPTSDYALELREQLRQAHENARKVLKVSAERQRRNYDRRVTSIVYGEKEFVWLHNPQRKVGVSSKLRLPWEGPYLIMDKLSDVHYRIQKSTKTAYKVVHADRLKRYEGPELQKWDKPPQPSQKSSGVVSTRPCTTPVPAPRKVHLTRKTPVPAPRKVSVEKVSSAPEEDDSEKESEIPPKPPPSLSDVGRRNPTRQRQLPARLRDYI